MSKKELLKTFINKVQDNNLLTEFISYLFDYKNLNDYNYIFRLSDNKDEVIIDIYDNVSNHRFNRYIFNYTKGKYKTRVIDEGNVFVTYIDVLSLKDSNNKLYKLAYMTLLENDKLIKYIKTFLPDKFVNILIEIIK